MILFLLLFSASAQALDSPCYDAQMQRRAEQNEQLRSMREMRPAANAPMQRAAQQNAQKGAQDYQSRMQQLSAPYLAQAQSLQSAAAGCSSPECALSVGNRTLALANNMMTNLLPQLQQIAAEARTEMINSQKMSMDHIQEMFQKNTGSPLPVSRGGSIHYVPVCRQFRPLASRSSIPMAPFEAHPFWKTPPPEKKKGDLRNWIRETNDKAREKLGSMTCVGSLMMGNVRCFQPEEDPQGYGRICEKVKGQVAACYDPSGAWTPPAFARRETGYSWFEKPPAQLKLLVGGVPMENLAGKNGPMEKAEQSLSKIKVKEPILLHPVDDGGNFKPPSTKKEPPIPFNVLEERVLSGKGLTQEQLLQMSDNDRLQLKQLIVDLRNQSETPGSVLAGKQLAKDVKEGVQEKYSQAADWTLQNKDNIRSTLDMMEGEALIFAPIAAPVAKGIEAAALTAEVASTILSMSAEGKNAKEISIGVGMILGGEKIKKLGEKGLTKIFVKDGYSPQAAEEMADNAIRYTGQEWKSWTKPKEGEQP